MARVAKWKEEEVDKLKNLILEYPIVGIVNMENIPARQLQKMRTILRGDVLIKMSKKSLMKRALEKASKEERSLVELANHIEGQPAFIFSKMNPFRLYKILEKNKARAPAKAKSIAPRDIVVPKGETPFPPGPMLGELQQVGIPTTVQAGKIAIKEDKVVVKEGERINPKVAAILSRLEIEPMEVGLDLVAAFEEGAIFHSDILAVDTDETISSLQLAYRNAFTLSINSGFLTKQSAPAILAKAAMDARNLAIERNIPEPGVMHTILTKAHSNVLSLKSVIGDALEKGLEVKKAEDKEKPKKKTKKKQAKVKKPAKKPTEKKKVKKKGKD